MAVEWIGKHVYPIYEAHLRGRKTFEYVAEYEANQQLSSDELHALHLCARSFLRERFHDAP